MIVFSFYFFQSLLRVVTVWLALEQFVFLNQFFELRALHVLYLFGDIPLLRIAFDLFCGIE
jgi:hypothetical protein